MARRSTLNVAAASSLAVMATLAAAPAAGAQSSCLKCVPDPGNGSGTAFIKIADQGFPGATEGVFHKDVISPAPAFIKIADLGFPGNTADAFAKVE